MINKPERLFLEGIGMSDEEASKMRNNVLKAFSRGDDYLANVLKLAFRDFFYNGNSISEYEKHISSVFDNDCKKEKRVKEVISLLKKHASKSGLRPKEYFHKYSWMISCQKGKESGTGYVGETSRIVSNFLSCLYNGNFNPEEYDDAYFRALLDDDSSKDEFARIVENIRVAEEQGSESLGKKADDILYKAFKAAKQRPTITCHVGWKLEINGGILKIILTAQKNFSRNVELGSFILQCGKGTNNGISKKYIGDGVRYNLSEMVKTFASLSQMSLVCEVRSGRPLPIADIDTEQINSFLSGEKFQPLVFEESDDDGVAWHSLVTPKENDLPKVVSSRHAWVILDTKETLPKEVRLRSAPDLSKLCGHEVYAHRVCLDDIDYSPKDYSFNGESLFLYQYSRQHRRISRMGFSELRVLDEYYWRAFSQEECSLTSPFEDEWDGMDSRNGVSVEKEAGKSICRIRPGDLNAFSEYEVKISNCTEHILFVPPSVLKSIREESTRRVEIIGENGWSFKLDGGNGLIDKINHAVDKGIRGTLKYSIGGVEKSKHLFVSLPLQKPVFWLERGASTFADMREEDCKTGRHFDSYVKLNQWYLCSCVPESMERIELTVQRHDRKTEKTHPLATEPFSPDEGCNDNYGRKALTKLAETVERKTPANPSTDNFIFDGNDLFSIDHSSKEPVILPDGQTCHFPREYVGNARLVLFTDRLLADDRRNTQELNVLSAKEMPEGVNEHRLHDLIPDELVSFKPAPPVYAMIVDSPKKAPEHWLAFLDGKLENAVLVKKADGGYNDQSFVEEKLPYLEMLFSYKRLRECPREMFETVPTYENILNLEDLGRYLDEHIKVEWKYTHVLPQIKDDLRFLLNRDFNFLAERGPQDKETWLDLAVDRILPNIVPGYAFDKKKSWGDEVRPLIRQLEDNEGYDRMPQGDGWLPAAVYAFFARGTRIREQLIRFNGDRVEVEPRVLNSLAEVSEVVRPFNGDNGVGFWVRNENWLVVREDAKEQAQELFGLSAYGMDNNLLKKESGKMLDMLKGFLREKQGPPLSGLASLAACAFGDYFNQDHDDDTSDDHDDDAYDGLVIGIAAVLCRAMAHGLVTFEDDKQKALLFVVKKAFDRKYYNGDDTYWACLMHGIVAADMAIRLEKSLQ